MHPAHYQSLSHKNESGSFDSSLGDDTDAFLHQAPQRNKKTVTIARTLFGTCVLLVFALLSLILYILKNTRMSLSDKECARQLSIPGPALEAVEYQTIIYRGAQEDDNPYKGHPNPALDAAWGELTAVRHVSISGDTMTAIKKSDNHAVQLPDGSYLGATEVFHQLHCLNLIRQHSYKEYYDVDGRRPPGLTDSAKTLRNHVDHCIDILRQNIMCTADTSVITHNWVKGYQFPYPNFNTQHKCRNFDKIVAWEKAHQVKDPARPSDAVVLETPPTT
ncbi:hypothetical protein BCR34DRAFT_567253 [Clohesyomyces aquaticus]|uniref:Tat pathway signal sequence n=1 Tax=Clohesyomyces aquaticus TaxID=1231657 RepID=A0A1Y1ZIX1_9PLEO|nr:hypothetical protein BCR34DRAFT_567253 [Clohesyomyces aquaticus]